MIEDETIDRNSVEIGRLVDGQVWYKNDLHSSFNGLIDLVFKYNNHTDLEITINKRTVSLWRDYEEKDEYNLPIVDSRSWEYDSKEAFILALQRCLLYILVNFKDIKWKI